MATGWKQAFSSFFRSTPMISMYGGVLVTGFYVSYKDYSRMQRMINIYKRGNILPPLADNKFEIKYQTRSREENTIKNLLNNNFTNEYYFIYGEIGVGKTRTIVEAVRELIQENGLQERGAPILVSVDQGKSFPETLAEAIDFNFDEHISFGYFLDIIWRIESLPRKDHQSKLTRVLDAIEESSYKYMLDTGKPVVLVIDAVNNLGKQMPDALEKLHDKAKLWADANIVKVVFVNNDEEVLQKLEGNASSWSRAACTIYFDDLTKSDAINFLTTDTLIESHEHYCKLHAHLSEDEAKQIFDLVGGRILDLIAFKRYYMEGVEEISRRLKDRVKEKFVRVSQTPDLWKVVATLREFPEKTMTLSKLIKCTSKKDVDFLKKIDILRYIRNDVGAVVKFSSTLTEKVVDELEQAYLLEKKAANQETSHGRSEQNETTHK